MRQDHDGNSEPNNESLEASDHKKSLADYGAILSCRIVTDARSSHSKITSCTSISKQH